MAVKAVCLLTLACIGNIQALRNLTDIRYHFTPCGVLGRNGPGYSSCSEFYSAKRSRLVQEDFLVESFDQQYQHAQRFKVPRFGLYNITAAGASGGRGVCNREKGYGTARTVQVELYLNLNLLVLVGQRGASFCDVEPDIPPCAETSSCDVTWQGYTEERGTVIGGGGGGGASMVRAYSLRGFDHDPIVIGGGGGGSSALLYYDVVEELGVNMVGLPSALAYQHYINADGVGSEVSSAAGLRNSTEAAGMGGGYGRNENPLDVDGGSLRDAREFAVGGLYCSMAELELNGTFGGFGGGGGGCSGGGGGGGYVGGRVAGQGMLIPGSGGSSYTGAPFRTSFKTIHFIRDFMNTEFEDGYVDIVHADCECIFKCVIYHEQDAFECTCPGNSLIAGDGSDCYFGTDVVIEEGPRMSLPPDSNGIVFNYQLFTLESRIYLYSVDFQVVLEETGAKETIFESCIVAFLGENNQLVAHTDIHRRSLQRLNTISKIDSDGTSQKLVSFLDSPVVVYAGLVVSAGNCSVQNMSLNMNISIRGRQLDESAELGSAIPSDVADEFLEDLTTPQIPHLLTTTLLEEKMDAKLAVSLGVFAAVIISVVVAGSVCSCIICVLCRKHPKSDGDTSLEEISLKFIAPESTRQTSVWKRISQNTSNHDYRNEYVLLHQ